MLFRSSNLVKRQGWKRKQVIIVRHEGRFYYHSVAIMRDMTVSAMSKLYINMDRIPADNQNINR